MPLSGFLITGTVATAHGQTKERNDVGPHHLFLDQDAIPTLVEVKRSSDSRIRREVVGQMLDYAANAVVYWPVEDIKAKFGYASADNEPPRSSLAQQLRTPSKKTLG